MRPDVQKSTARPSLWAVALLTASTAFAVVSLLLFSGLV